MSTVVLPMSSPNSLKRSYDEAIDNFPASPPPAPSCSSPVKTQHTQSSMSSIAHLINNHETQPNPSSIPEQSHPAPTFQAQLPVGTTPDAAEYTTNAPDASKKTKLSFAEKEARRIEKEFKAQERAAEKAKKDEERVQKEKEKAVREEERLKKAEEKKVKDEEKRKAKEERDRQRDEEKAKKDEEKAKKDAERAKKEEEKSKKERSQLRLNSFFTQGSVGSRSPTSSPRPTPSGSRRGSLAVEELQTPAKSDQAASNVQQKPVELSEYERAFPSFFVHQSVDLAAPNRFARDEAALSYARDKIDRQFSNGAASDNACTDLKGHLCELVNLPPRKRRRLDGPLVSLKTIVAQIDRGAHNTIDLTETGTKNDPMKALRDIPRKFLKFQEDVRPPYMGTYTKVTDRGKARKLARNPFSRNLDEANYDYDSEAEWEDPGEGEELLSEGEEELEDDEDDDMEEFLDDEDADDAKNAKRRPLLGEKEAESTGICWADAKDGPDLSNYRIDMLTVHPIFPIDPYTTAYWHQPTPKKPMNPPRIPLNPIGGTNTNLLTSMGIKSRLANDTPTSNSANVPQQTKKFIPVDILEDFKVAIEGSDLTKIGLVEQLKKKFPKQSKDTLKDSLDQIAERKGEKLADKKWVLRSGG